MKGKLFALAQEVVVFRDQVPGGAISNQVSDSRPLSLFTRARPGRKHYDQGLSIDLQYDRIVIGRQQSYDTGLDIRLNQEEKPFQPNWLDADPFEAKDQDYSEDFMHDLAAILDTDGPEAPAPVAGQNANLPPKAPAAKKPAPHPHDIFDRIAAGMQYANSYDLGTIRMEEQFDEFDQVLENHTQRAAAASADHRLFDELEADGAEEEPEPATALSMMDVMEDLDSMGLMEKEPPARNDHSFEVSDAEVVGEVKETEDEDEGIAKQFGKSGKSGSSTPVSQTPPPRKRNTEGQTLPRNEFARPDRGVTSKPARETPKANSGIGHFIHIRDTSKDGENWPKAVFIERYDGLYKSLQEKFNGHSEFWQNLTQELGKNGGDAIWDNFQKALGSEEINGEDWKDKLATCEFVKKMELLTDAVLKEPNGQIKNRYNFWSGGEGAQYVATQKTGGDEGITVLESLPLGQLFNGLTIDKEWKKAEKIWTVLSDLYTSLIKSDGPEIHAYITPQAKEDGIFAKVELPKLVEISKERLRKNKKLLEINFHFVREQDLEDLKEKLVSQSNTREAKKELLKAWQPKWGNETKPLDDNVTGVYKTRIEHLKKMQGFQKELFSKNSENQGN
ncbi:MAG: hypothetical protein H6564_06750 [Lewinellaceae bacterium]|nr:hypothetical protein [Lewinellaceae bacterium]